MEKYIYFFGELGLENKKILGGKGAGLSELKRINIPIPPGFTITSEICDYYHKKNKKYPKDFKKRVEEAMMRLEKSTHKIFGKNLFVSVRSGAEISMPGMMDTILNLGLNDKNVNILAKNTNNERFALDSYRRLIQMFGNVVMNIPHHEFETELNKLKQAKNIKNEINLKTDDLKTLIKRYKLIYKKHNTKFPQDPKKQLFMAINAVFNSWNNERAKVYRKINKINGLLGTAVNIVEMIYGNMDNSSGTGVLFTRNPNTGKNEIYGEFLPNAQGEDIVAGIRTPKKIDYLKENLPKVYKQIINIKKKVEKHFKDMQEIEFTIEKGKLFILQTRNGKRTANAAIKIAVDLVKERIITKKQAILRIRPDQIEQLLHPQLNVSKNSKVIGIGLAASPGGAIGKIVLSPEKCEETNESILIRNETSAEDIKGIVYAKGIITVKGGLTSHAAVVARGMGKPCVVGCENLIINEKENKIIFEASTEKIEINEGETISIDGNTGKIYLGKENMKMPKINNELKTLIKWCDSVKKLGIKTNAETQKDINKALEYGAEGIGLARTEHMFFGDRINHMRKVIFANSIEERRKALKDLLPMQRADFIEFFKLMKNKPVTIRLLDPPLHEFLPKTDTALNETIKTVGLSKETILKKINELKEINPMLGHRGCRLAITYPEIYGMQIQAIIEAAIFVKKNKRIDPNLQIMIPFVNNVKELSEIKKYIEGIISRMLHDYRIKIKYKIGTMIEVPRAALTSNEIAKEADFFSFGTNDLTQTTLGISRDGSEKFMQEYLTKEIYSENPFKTLDLGVKRLILIAKKLGKETNDKLEIGICGEQAGEQKTIEFCHKAGLDYISCSPYRIPIAKIVAARVALTEKYDCEDIIFKLVI